MIASDAAWNNAPMLVTAIGSSVAAIVGAAMLFLQRADAKKREAAEIAAAELAAAAAAKLDIVAHQTDGINKTIEVLAGKAGEKKGADELQAKIDSAAASVAQGKAEATKE